MERREVLWYGSLIAILFAVGRAAELYAWESADFFRALDYVITRGALVFGVYLFWRLVKAYERRATDASGDEKTDA